MALDSQEKYLAALDKTYVLERQEAKIVTQETPLCFKCGDHAHWARDCGEVQIQRSKREATNRFAVIQ